jgi:hypothetical protein
MQLLYAAGSKTVNIFILNFFCLTRHNLGSVSPDWHRCRYFPRSVAQY